MTRFRSRAQAGFVAHYAGGFAHARPDQAVATSHLIEATASFSANGVIPLFDDAVLTTPYFDRSGIFRTGRVGGRPVADFARTT